MIFGSAATQFSSMISDSTAGSGDDNDLQEVDFIEKLIHDQFQTTSSETEIDEFDDLQMVYF